MIVALHYVKEYRDRHGKVRRYYRRPGQRTVALSGEPGSREFMDAYEAAARGQRKPIGAERHDRRSLAAALSLYFGSQRFAAYAPDTRRTRKNELERFRAEHGERWLHLLDAAALQRIADKKRPIPGRNFLRAVSPFLDWCCTEGLIETNPAITVKRPRSTNREGFKTWPEELVAQYRRHHAIGTKPRIAFEVLVNVGSARVDTAPLGRQHVRNGLITYRRSKTKVLVRIPMLPDLQAAIDAMGDTGSLPFIAKQDGSTYTKESFGNQFATWCIEAGIPAGYRAHGLRKYAAKVRAEMGATANELMAWFGWLTEREATRYTRDADRLRLALELGRKVNPGLSNLGSG